MPAHGAGLRRPRRAPGQRKIRIPDMVNISERPKDVGDRTLPGHSEGDLIVGRGNLTATRTLVERATGYIVLIHLPEGRKLEQVCTPPSRR